VGTRSCDRRRRRLSQKRATASRPWYSSGIGGIGTLTSGVSKATSASTSPASHERTNCETSGRPTCESGAGGGSGSRCAPEAPERAAGAFERAVDRVDGRVQHAGDFVGLIAEHLAQDQHGALASGQQLQRGHKGERYGFGLLVTRFRARRDVEERVGIRLE